MSGTSLTSAELVVLHEDNHVLAVFKPAGVLVQSDRTGDPSLQDTAKVWLKERHGKPGNVFLGIVHRLDRPVAGVVLFAKTSKAAARLSQQFRERTVRKEYRAVVLGVPAPARGTLRHHLRRDEERRRTAVVGAEAHGAQAAALEYEVLATGGGCALLAVRPATGRSHQIRLQLAAAGHPIVGDTKYGAPAALPDRRIALYAARVAVQHPTRAEELCVESPAPPDWPWPPPAALTGPPAPAPPPSGPRPRPGAAADRPRGPGPRGAPPRPRAGRPGPPRGGRGGSAGRGR